MRWSPPPGLAGWPTGSPASGPSPPGSAGLTPSGGPRSCWTLALGVGGVALLALPALTASEQVSLGAAALAPSLALARSAAGWALDALRVAPTGLEALSEGLRGQGTLGLVALALLVPAGIGLRRVLARVPAERAPGRR